MNNIKKINPIFLLLGSIFVLLISVVLFFSAINNIKKKEINYQNYKKLALEYNEVFSSWSDIQKQKIIMEKLIKSSNINNAEIVYKNKQIKVKVSNITTQKIHDFTNKLLNKKLNITKLIIKENFLEIEVGNL